MGLVSIVKEERPYPYGLGGMDTQGQRLYGCESVVEGLGEVMESAPIIEGRVVEKIVEG